MPKSRLSNRTVTQKSLQTSNYWLRRMLVGFKLSIMIFTLQGDRIKRYFFSELQDEWREVFLVDTIGKLSFFTSASGFIMRFHTGTEIIGILLLKYFCCILIWSNLVLFNTRYNQVLSDSPGSQRYSVPFRLLEVSGGLEPGWPSLTDSRPPSSQSVPHYSLLHQSSLLTSVHFFLTEKFFTEKICLLGSI